MSISSFVDKCAQIENLVEQIYTIFMEQQASSPDFAKLWQKTANEEYNHEQQFLLAGRLNKFVDHQPDFSDTKLEAIISSLIKLKAQIISVPMSQLDSLKLAINIEEKLLEFHLGCIPLFSDESLNKLFKSMMNYDNGHIDDLKKALTDLCADDHGTP